MLLYCYYNIILLYHQGGILIMSKKQVAFRLEEDVYKQLQIYAIENDTSVQKILENHVIDLLKEQSGDSSPT